jgi:hypothetical protein
VEAAMKKFLGVVLVSMLLCSVCYSQRTENASNLILSYTGTASQDTLKALSSVRANSDSSLVKHFTRLVVASPIASDTIYVWEATNPTGARYLAKVIIPSTAPPPFFLDIDCKIDSAYVIVKRYKTSSISTVYRVGY